MSSWNQRISSSPWFAAPIAFLYTPSSDSFIGNFISPRSFLGDYFIHHIQNEFVAGFAGMGVSILANRIYDLAQAGDFWGWLEARSEQDFRHDAVQFTARAVIHVVVGTGLGLALSSATTGCAVGAAAFLGPQLVRAALKIAVFALLKFFKFLASSFTATVSNPQAQNNIRINHEETDNITEVQIYKAMGLNLGSVSAQSKNQTYSLYNLLASNIDTDIIVLNRQLNTTQRSLADIYFSRIYADMHQKEANEKTVIVEKTIIVNKLIESVLAMGEIVRHYKLQLKHPIQPFLLEALSMIVAQAVVNTNRSHLHEYKYMAWPTQNNLEMMIFSNTIKYNIYKDGELYEEIWSISKESQKRLEMRENRYWVVTELDNYKIENEVIVVSHLDVQMINEIYQKINSIL